MRLDQVGAIGGLLPDLTHVKHAIAAGRALERAALAMEPLGTPEDPKTPDIEGARRAFREATEQLRLVLDHAGGRPGHLEVEVALEEAQEALMHLTTPGINPPVADVLEHAMRGGEIVRQAVTKFDHDPAGWIFPPVVEA